MDIGLDDTGGVKLAQLSKVLVAGETGMKAPLGF